MLLLFGIPVFVFMKWRQSKVPVEAELRAFTLQRPPPPLPTPSRRVPSTPTRKEKSCARSSYGRGGRDFHDFNVVYRDDPEAQVWPSLRRRSQHRRAALPAELAGKLYPDGHRDRAGGARCRTLVREIGIDEVVLAYSDLSHEDVMHKAAHAVALGRQLPAARAEETMLRSTKPVIAVVRGADRLRQERCHRADRPVLPST